MKNRMAQMDMGLFTALLVMMGFGLVLVYSSSFAIAQQHYLVSQASRALLGIAVFMIVVNVDYHIWGKLSNLILVLALLLLVAVLLLPDSYSVNGAKRWFPLGPLNFQVSDFARVAIILAIARSCEKAGDSIVNLRVFINMLIKIGIVCVLILAEPNMSTAVIIGTVTMAMVYLSGAKTAHIASLFLAVIPVAIALILKTPYRLKRLLAYMDGSGSKSSVGYQTYQSLIGLGNGGLFGVGLGKGEQKYFYLPEPHTDFAISILGEELGFIGLMIIFGLFTFIIWRGMKAALHAPDKMGQLMAFGFTTVVAIYTLIHAFVGSGLIPTTGIPLPFLSFGGMNMIFMMLSMGIVLNISSQSQYGLVPKSKLKHSPVVGMSS